MPDSLNLTCQEVRSGRVPRESREKAHSLGDSVVGATHAPTWAFSIRCGVAKQRWRVLHDVLGFLKLRSGTPPPAYVDKVALGAAWKTVAGSAERRRYSRSPL